MLRNPVFKVAAVVILIFVLVLPACGQAATPTPTAKPAATQAPAAATPTQAAAAATPTKAAAAATPTTAVTMGGTLNVAKEGDGTGGHFDVNMLDNRALAQWWSPVYESLLGHSMDTFEIIPRLAEKWEVSADGKTYTLSLRKGVKWHNVAPVNGREFTSDDVKWNIERIRDLEAKAYWNSTMKMITEVQTPDKYTVKLSLKEPFAPLLAALADASLMMYPKEVYEAYGAKQSKVAIGTGPFMLKTYEPEVALRFVKNPDYWEKGLPRLDAVNLLIIKDPSARLAALRTGQVDYLDSVTAANRDALKQSNPELTVTPHLGYAFILNFNAKKKPLDDVRVRKAIALAIDRQELIKLAVSGSGELLGLFRADVVPSGAYRTPAELAKLPGYTTPKDADIAEAKKLLADAGYANGLQIEALTLSILPDITKSNEILKEQMKKIGIDWTIRLVDYAQFNQITLESADFQVAMVFGMGGDLDTILNNQFNTTSKANVNGWGSADIDKLLAAGRVEGDVAKRAQVYRQIEDLNMNLAFCTGLFTTQNFWLTRPGYKELRPMFGTNIVYFADTYKYAWISK